MPVKPGHPVGDATLVGRSCQPIPGLLQMLAKGSQTPIVTAWLALENVLRHPVLSGDSSFFARLRTTYPSLVFVHEDRSQNITSGCGHGARYRSMLFGQQQCEDTEEAKTACVLAIERFVQQYTSSRLALPTDSATGYDSTTGAVSVGALSLIHI